MRQNASEETAISTPVWNVEVSGDLVAILSDSQWLSSWEIDGELELGVEQSVKSPSLQAASNIVLDALTHTGGLATKRERLLWAAATGVTPMISGAQPF